MKIYVTEFIRRGLTASGLGPVVLAVLYLIAHKQGSLQTITVQQVCIGIFSLSALAFVAGGMNVVYQIERLPLMQAIAIHGSVLYISYLITYLVNSWLEWELTPIVVFTGIFLIGYITIWVMIYAIIRRNTDEINKKLKAQQEYKK